MSSDARVDDDPFVAHRGLLFTVAYELLGSAADAEDVLQESWLRWATTLREACERVHGAYVRSHGPVPFAGYPDLSGRR